MKSLVSHITESLNNTIIDDLLTRMSDTLDNMVQKIEDEHNSNELNLRKFSDYDRKITRAILTRDIVKSFATYTLTSDKLVDFSVTGTKGTVIISATINREGSDYQLSTSVIYAGGYNVQRLHYRYITSTSLPKQKNSETLRQFEEKIKKLSKGEKLQKDILLYDTYIDKLSTSIEHNSKLTDDQKLQTSLSYKYLILKYSEINRDSFSWQEWENKEIDFEKHQEQERKDFIKSFDNRNEVDKRRIKEFKQQILKLETKLSLL